MKKTLLISLASAVILLVAVPVFAGWDRCGRCGDQRDRCCPSVDVDTDNYATVINDIDTWSNTGLNRADRNVGTGRVTTGNAKSDALVNTTANVNQITVDSPMRGSVDVDTDNHAMVVNDVTTVSNTGLNEANANGRVVRSRCRTHVVGGSGAVTTGAATSIATAVTMVNSNVVDVD